MLKPSSPEAAECYARPQEARERADSTQNLEMRAIYLDSEQQWLKLAASYEATTRVTVFLGEAPIVKHPICKSCGVAMWLVKIRESIDCKQHLFECKGCNDRMEVTENRSSDETARRLEMPQRPPHPHRKEPLAMDKTVEVLALYASATQNALVTLSKCLTDNGALKPGQFSSAIKATLKEAEVDLERPYYHYLQVLAEMLDGAEAPASGIN